jgi:uncharacterized membrane protein YqjE
VITAEQTNDRRRLSTKDLVVDLSQQASALVRQEIELAKLELAEKAKAAGAGAAALAGALVGGLLALGSLTACLILALDGLMPNWLAALVVAVAWAALALVLALIGRDRLRRVESPVPEETVETLKEDIEWLKHPTK